MNVLPDFPGSPFFEPIDGGLAPAVASLTQRVSEESSTLSIQRKMLRGCIRPT